MLPSVKHWVNRLRNTRPVSHSTARRRCLIGVEELEPRWTPSNTPPVAVADSYSVNHGDTLNVPVMGVLANDSDAESDPLDATLSNFPSHAMYFLLNEDGSFVYTPVDGYTGSDSFSYRAHDGANYSNVASVQINVTNNAPTGTPDNYSVDSGQGLSPDAPGVLGNDDDANDDPIVANLLTLPAHAMNFWLNQDGSFVYEPLSSYSGPDAFSYRVFDGVDYSAPVTVSITVNNVAPADPVDSNPMANTVNESALPGTPVGITVQAQDFGGGTLTFSLTDDVGGRFTIHPSTGVVTIQYADLVDFDHSDGTYTIKARASDGSLFSGESTFTITVNNVAPANPVDINIGPNSVFEGAATGSLVNINAAAPDPAGGTVTYALTDNAGGRFAIGAQTGVVSVANGSLINYSSSGGSYSIKVQASDGDLVTSEVTFTISVAVSSGLQAIDDYYYDSNFAVNRETGLLTISESGVLGNDAGDGSPMPTVTLLSDTMYGDLTLNSNGSFTYVPTVQKADYPGYDSFVYQISNGTTTDTATVHIYVDDPYHTDPKDPPVGTPAPTARVIQGPGRYTFYYNSIVFISNNTVSGDWWCIWWQGGSPRYENIGSWTSLVTALNGPHTSESYHRIYISGHGAIGGIRTNDVNTPLTNASLTDAQAAAIRAKLRPDSAIVLLGCGQGTYTETQDLATRIQRAVIANTGSVWDGNWADGSWVRFDP